MLGKQDTYTQYCKRIKMRKQSDLNKQLKKIRKDNELKEIAHLRHLVEQGSLLVEQLVKDGGITNYAISRIKLEAKRYARDRYRTHSKSVSNQTWRKVIEIDRTVLLIDKELRDKSRRKKISIDNKVSSMFFSTQKMAEAIKQETKELSNG